MEQKGAPMAEALNVLRENKDNVFRMLYRDKKNLLQLYNALNDTAYADPSALEMYTLENAIFMNVKNDVSFLVNSVLNLYEQQSSVNPNMPLRDLIYIARQFEKYIRNRSIYSSKLIKIPAPRFVVFYNGVRKQPARRTLRLSDAFEEKAGDPELELKVQMFNINPGYNCEILEKCQTLREYSLYVDRIRAHTRHMPVNDAVRLAVDECIRDGILSNFLLTQKTEVIAMSIFEYNEEAELKKIREDEYSLGVEAGIEEGIKEGLRAGRIEALVLTCREFGLSRAPE